jgi:integrase/recombinase XerD
MRKIVPWEQEFIDFAESYPESKYMLEKVAKSASTKVAYAIGVKYLTVFLNKTPTEIVKEYQTDVKQNMYEAFGKWEKIFDDFKMFLEKQGRKGAYSPSTVKLFHSGAKALINANVPRSLRLQAETPEAVSRTIKGVSLDELKSIYDMCDVRERAFIAVLKDSGISAADALTLNLEDLEGFEKGEEWIHISMFRGKEHVEYETFLGPNAVTALKAYLNLRKQKGENITPKSPIFASEHKPYERLDSNGLKVLFKRIQRKTGITVSTHRLRKFFETYMALVVRHPIVLKYWMGHKIRKGRDVEARYIIPPTPEQMQLYKQAYSHIDLQPKADVEFIKRRQEISELIMSKIMSGEPLTDEDRENIRRYNIKLAERALRRRQTQHNGGMTDCQFEQIAESQLLSYLQAGWSIVHRLSNGDIIVKR